MFRRLVNRSRSAGAVFRQRTTVQRRNMGGGHAPPPTDGIDGVVRKYLPEDHQVSMAIIGMYFTLYLISKIPTGSKKKKSSAPTSAATSTSSGAIPALDSPEFDAWISTPGNIEKVLS